MAQHKADDLTAERAAAVEEQISDAINRLAYPRATIRRIVKDAMKTARQEALREAIDKVTDRALLWRSHGGAKMAFPYDHLTVEGECDAIASILDRLASEGG